MNGREVFKFATRVMVSSAEAILDECGKTVDDVDVYVPHQANVRIIDHAVRKLGVADGEDRGQRRPIRQHFLGLDPARARRCGGRRAARTGQAGAVDRHGRRPDLGIRADRLDTSRRLEQPHDQDRIHVPRPGLVRGRHGQATSRRRCRRRWRSTTRAARPPAWT